MKAIVMEMSLCIISCDVIFKGNTADIKAGR